MKTRFLTPDLEHKATGLTVELLGILCSLDPESRAELIRKLKRRATLGEAVANWERAEAARRRGRFGFGNRLPPRD